MRNYNSISLERYESIADSLERVVSFAEVLNSLDSDSTLAESLGKNDSYQCDAATKVDDVIDEVNGIISYNPLEVASKATIPSNLDLMRVRLGLDDIVPQPINEQTA